MSKVYNIVFAIFVGRQCKCSIEIKKISSVKRSCQVVFFVNLDEKKVKLFPHVKPQALERLQSFNRAANNNQVYVDNVFDSDAKIRPNNVTFFFRRKFFFI